jgi:hypothetical protein
MLIKISKNGRSFSYEVENMNQAEQSNFMFEAFRIGFNVENQEYNVWLEDTELRAEFFHNFNFSAVCT